MISSCLTTSARLIYATDTDRRYTSYFSLFHAKNTRKYGSSNDSLFLSFFFYQICFSLFPLSLVPGPKFNSRRILTRCSHSRISFHPHGYTRAFELNININFSLLPALQKKNTPQKPRRTICVSRSLPVMITQKYLSWAKHSYVSTYYTKSIRIGSTNKTGRCAKVSRRLTLEGWAHLI